MADLSGTSTRHAEAGALAMHADLSEPAGALIVPEGPAIAGVQPLHMGAHAVDRACLATNGHRAVGAHFRGPSLLRVEQGRARLQQAGVDQADEGDARFGTLAMHQL